MELDKQAAMVTKIEFHDLRNNEYCSFVGSIGTNGTDVPDLACSEAYHDPLRTLDPKFRQSCTKEVGCRDVDDQCHKKQCFIFGTDIERIPGPGGDGGIGGEGGYGGHMTFFGTTPPSFHNKTG